MTKNITLKYEEKDVSLSVDDNYLAITILLDRIHKELVRSSSK